MRYDVLKDLGLGAGVLYGVLKSNELYKRINELQKKIDNTVPEAQVVVKKIGEEAWAIDNETKQVITHGTDHAEVIQRAIEYASKLGKNHTVYVSFALSARILAITRNLARRLGVIIYERRKYGVVDIFAGGSGVVLNRPIYDPTDPDTVNDFPTLFYNNEEKAKELLDKIFEILGDWIEATTIFYLYGGMSSRADEWYIGLRKFLKEIVDRGVRVINISSWKYGYSPVDPSTVAPFNTNDYNSLVNEYRKLGEAIADYKDYIVCIAQRPPGFDWSYVPGNTTFLNQLKQEWNDWLYNYTGGDTSILQNLWSDYDSSTEPFGSIKLPMNDFANYPDGLDSDPRWYLFSLFITEKLANFYADLAQAVGVHVIPADFVYEHGYRPIIWSRFFKVLKERGIEVYGCGGDMFGLATYIRYFWGDKYDAVEAPHPHIEGSTYVHAFVLKTIDRGHFVVKWVVQDEVTYDSDNDRIITRPSEFFSAIFPYPTPRPRGTISLYSFSPAYGRRVKINNTIIVRAMHPSITVNDAVLEKLKLLDLALPEYDVINDVDFEDMEIDLNAYDLVVLLYPKEIVHGERPKLHSKLVSKYKNYLIKGGRMILMIPVDGIDYGWFDEHVRSQDTWLGGPLGWGDGTYFDFVNEDEAMSHQINMRIRGVGVNYETINAVEIAKMGEKPMVVEYTSSDWGYIAPSSLSDTDNRSRVVSVAIDTQNEFFEAGRLSGRDEVVIPEVLVKAIVISLKRIGAPVIMSEDGVIYYPNLAITWQLPILRATRIKKLVDGGDISLPTTAGDVDISSAQVGGSNNPIKPSQAVVYRISSGSIVPSGRTRIGVYFAVARIATYPVVNVYYRDSSDIGKVHIHSMMPGGRGVEATWTNKWMIIIDNLTGSDYTLVGDIYIEIYMP